MRRGEIRTVAGGADYAGKPRPVVIIQDDRFPGTLSVTVVPLTTNPADTPIFRRIVEPGAGNGLSQPSRLMVDKLMTVPRAKLGRLVGELEAGHMVWIGQAVLVFLGFAGPPADHIGETGRATIGSDEKGDEDRG